jgi:hypothetical protein
MIQALSLGRGRGGLDINFSACLDAFGISVAFAVQPREIFAGEEISDGERNPASRGASLPAQVPNDGDYEEP